MRRPCAPSDDRATSRELARLSKRPRITIMWHAIYNTSRYLLAAMAFSVAFFLTPRVWIESSAQVPAEHNHVSVDTLDESDSCLWCDEPPTRCGDDSDDQLWLNPDNMADPADCDDDESSDSGPNA